MMIFSDHTAHIGVIFENARVKIQCSSHWHLFLLILILCCLYELI